MVIYLFACIVGLSLDIISLGLHGMIFDFSSLRVILNDALYTLIVLVIVKPFLSIIALTTQLLFWK